MQLTITAPIRPTEDPDKVVDAATQWWAGDVDVDDRRVRVVATGDLAMDAFRARVWELRIIDTLRASVLAGCKGAVAEFMISKQAAHAGKISLPAAPHALGDLMVRVDVEEGDPWEDAEAFAWWLCPVTADGQIVGPTD